MLFATFNFFCWKQYFGSALAPFPFPIPHTSIQQNFLNVQYTTIDKQRFRMVKFMKKRGLKITWHCLFNNIEIKQLTSGFCYKKNYIAFSVHLRPEPNISVLWKLRSRRKSKVVRCFHTARCISDLFTVFFIFCVLVKG